MKQENLNSVKSRALNVLIVILLVSTLILASLNLKDYLSRLEDNAEVKIEVKETKSSKNPKLKPLRLDVARFEIEVVKPHKDMLAKFPKHPEMVIKKLSKLLDKEKNK